MTARSLRVALAALVTVAAGCGGPSGTSSVDADVRPGGQVDGAGVSLAAPPGWVAVDPVPTTVSDPVRRIAIGSGPTRPNVDPDCRTQATEVRVPETEVLLLVLEYTSDIAAPARSWPARPELFDNTVSSRIGGRFPAGLECHGGPYWSFEFADQGRRLLAWIVIGTRAPAEKEAQALASLNTLRVATD